MSWLRRAFSYGRLERELDAEMRAAWEGKWDPKP